MNAAYKTSRNVLNTITPPISQARRWTAAYRPTIRRPLINMSQGVPGTPPHTSLMQALGRVTTNEVKSYGYSGVEGHNPLRRALAREMKVVYGKDTDVGVEDIVLTSGCNLAFIATVMSLADPGDEVILPVPWYFNQQMALSLLGVKTVPLILTEETDFQPCLKACQKLITPKTKAITLVTPNNPTGASYSPALLTSFLELARANNIALILDETYRDFILPGPPHSLFTSSIQSTAPWRQNLIHLFSFSKSYSIPGLRLGAIIASPTHIQSSLVKILDTLQICPSLPGQMALAPLMESLRPSITENAKLIEKRQTIFRDSLPRGWEVGAQGGFFAFVKHPFKGMSATEVCRRMAMEGGLVTLPGSFFSQNGDDDGDRWIRFSVANVCDEGVINACRRLEECSEEFGWKVDA